MGSSDGDEVKTELRNKNDDKKFENRKSRKK